MRTRVCERHKRDFVVVLSEYCHGTSRHMRSSVAEALIRACSQQMLRRREEDQGAPALWKSKEEAEFEKNARRGIEPATHVMSARLLLSFVRVFRLSVFRVLCCAVRSLS